jgi:hypothetical protein
VEAIGRTLLPAGRRESHYAEFSATNAWEEPVDAEQEILGMWNKVAMSAIV